MKLRIVLPFLLFSIAGFFGLKAQIFTNYTTADGLVSNNVNWLAIGANDVVWFGTQGGISKYDGNNWTTYTTADGLVDNNVLAIFEDASGNLWAGTDFGLSRYDGSNWTTYTTVDGLGNDRIKCVEQGSNGNIWVGTSNGVAELSNGVWTSWGMSDGLPFGGVNAIDFEANGDVWLGLGLSGVAVFDGTNFSIFDESDGLIDDRIRAIAFDSLDQAWIGTSEGVSVFDNSSQFLANHPRMYIMPPPDTLNPTEDVKIDSKGNIWSGIYVDYLVTVGGIAMYDGNQWIDYDQTDGLIGPVIRSLGIDADDHVWIGTSTGVSELDLSIVGLDEEVAEEQFTVYPNPAADLIYIQMPQNSLHEGVVVEVYNMNLQLVATQAVLPGQQKAQLAIDFLDAGIYMVKIGDQMQKVARL